ncbi:MAG: tetratricopeptide repeat protein, partial [Deltaproteobacteria bacterium]|nr:tetratricopeptide repeat protein [Deltaproteobacteria bacterium]
LPEETNPATRLRVCCDGETIVALADDVAFQPIGGQVVMAFNLPSFGEHVAQILAMPRVDPNAAPEAVEDDRTEANGGTTAYRYFVEACAAEDRGESQTAEHLFRQAVDLEPNMAAALTNLGNLVYRQGELEEAKRLYERALEHDPIQPEARYNLANVLEDLGETEAAVTELRKVCATAPDFPDAHYNLGIMLAQLGGTAQAKHHLERYLELDTASDWAGHARTYLDQIAV